MGLHFGEGENPKGQFGAEGRGGFPYRKKNIKNLHSVLSKHIKTVNLSTEVTFVILKGTALKSETEGFSMAIFWFTLGLFWRRKFLTLTFYRAWGGHLQTVIHILQCAPHILNRCTSRDRMSLNAYFSITCGTAMKWILSRSCHTPLLRLIIFFF